MAQELLNLEAGAMSARTASAAISRPLRSFLDSASKADEAARLIRHRPELADEAIRVQPLIARLCGPMGARNVYTALQPLIVLFGTPDYGKGEIADSLTKTWVQIWGETLAKYPAESVTDAVAMWISHGKPFFPKPTELVALAEPKARELWKLAYRLKVVAERAAKDMPPELDSSEQELIQTGLKELAATLAAKRLPEAPRHGMSREKMAERIRAAG
jgi:hypothetical protein